MTPLLLLLAALLAAPSDHAADVREAEERCDLEVLRSEERRLYREVHVREDEPEAAYRAAVELREVRRMIRWCGARL